MNKTAFLLIQLFIITGIMSFVACDKNEIFTETKNITEKTDKDNSTQLPVITIDNGILVFKNREDVKTFLSVMNTKGGDFEDKWSEKTGFTSQQYILKKATTEEERYFDNYNSETLTESDILKIQKDKEKIGYTLFTKEYIKKGVIKELITEDGDTILDYTVALTPYARIINEDGFVIINDTIYQYTANQIKMITDGDLSKIKLLKTLTKSDTTLNISISNLIAKENILKREGDMIIGKTLGESGDIYNCHSAGCKRMRASVQLNIYEGSTSSTFTFFYLVYGRCQKQSFGKWRSDDDADSHFWATFSITDTYDGPYDMIADYSKWIYNSSGPSDIIAECHNTTAHKFSNTTMNFYRNGGSNGLTGNFSVEGWQFKRN